MAKSKDKTAAADVKPAADTPALPARPVRRTQSERREATRERVIAAAMGVLHTQGYSGATTQTIRAAADVSMGAMQHQFSTKAKLMAAVAERYAERRLDRYQAAVEGVDDPQERVMRLLDVSAAMVGEPEVAANLELLLARRNDAELDQETSPILSRVDERMRGNLQAAARSVGLDDLQYVDRLRLLNNAVTRGFTVELVSGGNPAEVAAALAIWREAAMKLFFDGKPMQAPAQADKPKPQAKPRSKR